ncbi:MAG: TlyA family RNA methyltransferase [Desulfovibrio sp.]|nr:MAG: TlyA family RNA methyltransferase [Desulfovibrio sp.]
MGKPPKQRADHLLVAQGLAESREQAKRLIMAGKVFLPAGKGIERVDKPGKQLNPDIPLSLQEEERFVSRGAYKLMTAIDSFALDLADKVVLDAGASTGGFTDCALQHGARKVYSVDVGYGQLHAKLRQDPRVVCLERINLRLAEQDLIPEPVDLVTIDVSFISLKLILPPCLQYLRPGGEIVALIKPQFEVGPGQTQKGVVKDPELRQRAVDMITEFAARQLGLTLKGCVPSAILGPKGNQEFLSYFQSPA